MDAIARLRAADGMSHARSLAFMIVLTSIPALIALIGLTAALGEGDLRTTITDILVSVGPGPAGDVLTTAIEQGSEAGARRNLVPLVFGLVAAAISGTTAFGQIERGANRIYGIEQDRPTLRKYGFAAALAVSSGLLVVFGFVLLSAGHTVTDSIDPPGSGWIWTVVRWIIGARSSRSRLHGDLQGVTAAGSAGVVMACRRRRSGHGAVARDDRSAGPAVGVR